MSGSGSSLRSIQALPMVRINMKMLDVLKRRLRSGITQRTTICVNGCHRCVSNHEKRKISVTYYRVENSLFGIVYQSKGMEKPLPFIPEDGAGKRLLTDEIEKELRAMKLSQDMAIDVNQIICMLHKKMMGRYHYFNDIDVIADIVRSRDTIYFGDQGQDQITTNINQVNNSVNVLNNSVDVLRETVGGMAEGFKEMAEGFKKLGNAVQAHDEKFEEVESDVGGLKSTVSNLESRMAAMEQKQAAKDNSGRRFQHDC